MQLINHQYESIEGLETFISNGIGGSGTVLIQLFSGMMDKAVLQPVLDLLASRLPNAALIGVTTAGEIMNGTMGSEGIVISFSLFDATDVRTYYYPQSDYEHGVRAAQEIVSDRTKACIAFSEGLKSDSESFLKGFTSVRSDVMFAGGNAGDNNSFTQTHIMQGSTVYDEGIVIAVLDSDVLQVNNAYSLYWTPVGKEMTVTRAEKNVIYEIDGRPVSELYTHYLGAETVALVPASAIEFPLVKVKDGVRIARSIIAQTDDGGFVYAGHFHNGDRVRFAIGNVEEVLNHASDIQRSVCSAPVEATYIYSCAVRKLFIDEQLNYEFGLIEEVSPTAGFFTYGEFFHSTSDNQLLNITTTTLSLGESETAHCSGCKSEHEYRHTMLKSLTYLVNVTQAELDDSITLLDQYKMVLDESSIVSKTDIEGNITYVNDAFCRLSGYTRDELIGKEHNIVSHPQNPPELFRQLWRTVTEGKIWKGTFKNRSKEGHAFYVKSVIVPIFDDERGIVEFIAASTDVTELILKDEIIQRQLTDTLTGLENRTALFSDLENSSEKKTLVLFNIDRFSEINDYFGYETGDALLKAFAVKFRTQVEHDHLYRISGDEFALICGNKEFGDALREKIIGHINTLQRNTYQIDAYDISINVSSGVAYAESTEIYRLAHLALKEAKEQRVKVVFFNDNQALHDKTRNNIMMVNKIKSAIEEDRIVPYFQGIVDNRTRRIVKYESLIRLIDSDGTVLSPFWFLEPAKKSKLYDKLTRIMIAKTFAVFEGLEYEFSINLSLQDILSERTREFLVETLRGSSASHRLVLEIVESEGIENFEEVRTFIETVKAYGCKIAIDDFGTGYSNFSYLNKLDADYIKIDGSLIKDIAHNEDHVITVESILLFAQKKQIKTIAEFVEDEAVFAKLLELGIDFSQGYLFSVPAADIQP